MKKIEPVDCWGPIEHEHLMTYEQKDIILIVKPNHNFNSLRILSIHVE